MGESIKKNLGGKNKTKLDFKKTFNINIPLVLSN